MSVGLEEQIRRYTQTLDSRSSPLDELLPDSLAWDADVGSVPDVAISVPLGPGPRQRRAPSWVTGLAAAAFVLLLAIPLWLFSSNEVEEPAGTQTTLATDPFLRAESGGVTTGVGWSPSGLITLAVNGIEGNEAVQTDPTGDFNVDLASVGLSLAPGDTLTATDGTFTRRILIPVLTVEIFDPELGVASGTTSLPDGTEVELRVAGPGDDEFLISLRTTVQAGTWNFEFDPMLSPGQNASESWVSVPAGDGPFEIRLQP